MEESEVQASSLQCCVGWLHPWTQVTALVRRAPSQRLRSQLSPFLVVLLPSPFRTRGGISSPLLLV